MCICEIEKLFNPLETHEAYIKNVLYVANQADEDIKDCIGYLNTFMLMMCSIQPCAWMSDYKMSCPQYKEVGCDFYELQEEALEHFNIDGCMNYECWILKYDEYEELEIACHGEDISCIMERAIQHGHKIADIKIARESSRIILGRDAIFRFKILHELRD